MKITGKITLKKYRCTECGHVSEHATNHYGEIYPRCKNCGWKNAYKLSHVHECLEPVPEGWGIPEKWKLVKLGDICEIVQGVKIK